MAHGIIVKHENGTNLLASNDKLGRIVGWHDITPLPTGTFRYEWNHSNLQRYGTVFAWCNPNFGFNQSGTATVTLNGGIIVFSGTLYPFSQDWNSERYMRIFYGVMG